MIQATENMPWERLFLKILHSPTGGSDVVVTTYFFEEYEKHRSQKSVRTFCRKKRTRIADP